MSDSDASVVPKADEPSSAGEKREEFFHTMIGTLCDTIEDVVGVTDAEAFIGIVGRRLGGCANCMFGAQDGDAPEDVTKYLADAYNSIGGDFVVEDIDGAKITLSNSRCPFGVNAIGRPSICKMTTNFFGRIAADTSGYARVDVKEALLRGDSRCLITVELERDGDSNGQEFYG
jgi:predicted ArsR family transcriptional regulator